MKKLLYTLLLGIVVISCEKDNEGDYNSLVAPSQEIEATVKNNIDFDALTNRLNDLVGRAGKMESKDLNTRRTTGGHIALISKSENGNYFEFLFSDDIDICQLDGYTQIFLVLNGTDTEVRLSTSDGLLLTTITTDFSALYAITFSEGLKVPASGAPVVVDGSGGTSFTF